MTIEQIKGLLYNQAVDGEFSETSNAIKLIEGMTKTQEEIVMASFWIGWNESFDKISAQENLIEKLVDFITFVIKCLKQNGEYSPVSSQEPREIEAIIKEYYKL